MQKAGKLPKNYRLAHQNENQDSGKVQQSSRHRRGCTEIVSIRLFYAFSTTARCGEHTNYVISLCCAFSRTSSQLCFKGELDFLSQNRPQPNLSAMGDATSQVYAICRQVEKLSGLLRLKSTYALDSRFATAYLLAVTVKIKLKRLHRMLGLSATKVREQKSPTVGSSVRQESPSRGNYAVSTSRHLSKLKSLSSKRSTMQKLKQEIFSLRSTALLQMFSTD